MLLTGCHRNPQPVYVDMEEVMRMDPAPEFPENVIPNPPVTRPLLIETIPGEPETFIQDPSNVPRQSVQEMFNREQAKALQDLERRLRQFYENEIIGFRLKEEKAINGEEQAAYALANVKLRPLFEKWAKERAPKFARLAVIAGFPDPNPTSKAPDDAANLAAKKRSAEAKTIRQELFVIDSEFQTESKSLIAALLAKSSTDQAALKLKVDAFASDLDKRAQAEARSQIRQANSKLSFQLTKPTPIQVPATQAHHITIPAENPLDPAPKVPSSGILVSTADRRRLLDHELKIWLALNRYTFSPISKGHRNATTEFQIWRQQHGAGP